MRDLNDLIPAESNIVLTQATGINNFGDIAAVGYVVGNNPYIQRGYSLKIPREKLPLIFIPGVSGTELKNNNPLKTVWFPNVPSVLYDPNEMNPLSLAQAENENNVYPSEIFKTLYPIQGSTVGATNIYQDFIDRLNLREYNHFNDPFFRTTSGCDLRQATNKPGLFIFPYDWRKSNDVNADELRKYVECVQLFYPNTKVNIVTHSMGGLIARRYILKYPNNHSVDKLVTIVAPWLGAPKAIYTLETGRFFFNELTGFVGYPKKLADISPLVLDFRLQEKMKELAEFFPAVHELIPSRAYHQLSEAPYKPTVGSPYTYEQLKNWLDQQHPNLRSKPGTRNANFHDFPSQDDWRGDSTGVKYYHIYGKQNHNVTPGRIYGSFAVKCSRIPIITCYPGLEYRLVAVECDGTVPVTSASKMGNGYDLNYFTNTANDQRIFPINSTGDDTLVEHGGIMLNQDEMVQ